MRHKSIVPLTAVESESNVKVRKVPAREKCDCKMSGQVIDFSESMRSMGTPFASTDAYWSDDESTLSSEIDTANYKSAPNLGFEPSNRADVKRHISDIRRNSVEARRSFAKAIGGAFASPAKSSKGKVSAPVSPLEVVDSMRRSIKKTGKNAKAALMGKDSSPKKDWREECDLPPGTSREEALAVLLCRELGSIDM